MINSDRDEFVQDNPLAAAMPQAGEDVSADSDFQMTAAAGDSWSKKTKSARERTERFVRNNPVPMIVGGLVLGLVAGWALRHATREEKESEVKTPLGDLNWSFLSLPFLWPFFKSVKEKYEDSADTIKETVRDGVGKVRKIDLGDYAKPLRKRWKAWRNSSNQLWRGVPCARDANLARVIRLLPFVLVAWCATASAETLSQSHDDHTGFVGSVGCKSSSCHGGAGEKRSQYITWSQKDFHTRGFAILLDARSARIGEAIGIPQPQSSARCTVCHSPFASVAPSRLGPNVRTDEGVSCETCHGAAEGWLRGHTRTDWTYATRVTAGMHDLRSLYVRANACAACHQNVDTDILKAGHPALVFELDSQSTNEPKHWREDDPRIGPRSWLVGQAVALRESAWHARNDADPSSDAQENAMALAWLLSKVTLVDPGLPRIVEPESSDLEPVQRQADELGHRAADWNATNDTMMSILRAVVESEPEFVSGKGRSRDTLLYRAVRVTLALERFSVALDLSAKVDKELNALRQDVQRRYDFDPAVFAEHLRAFGAKL